jgi:tetratricopeptide (TPR) repeat protein
MRARLSLVAVLILPAALFAGETHSQHQHGAPDLGNIGKAQLPTSCNAAAQSDIDRGVTLMHSFWYVEAEKAFRKAAASDAECAMAWWGVAMANLHPLWAQPNPDELKNGREAAEKALALGGKTDRERAYVKAIHTYYKDADKLDHRTRMLAYENAMRGVAGAYANDHEASIFHALSLIGIALPTDKTYANQKKAAEILNRVLPLHPEHPGVAHYIIHSFDYPDLANLALPAARVYAKLAPGSPHALHMPSHIFTRLGLWEESIASNLASAAKAKSYVAQLAPGVTSFEELHAIDYLIYAYLQRGEQQKARKLLKRLHEVAKVDTPNFAAAFALAAGPARYVLERRQWREAAALTVPGGKVAWDKMPYAEANIHFAVAIGGARSNQLDKARRAVTRMEEIRKTLLERKDSYWADQVAIQRLAGAAWIANAERRQDDALRLMREAAALESSTEKHPVTPGAILPARELLADMLLELGDAEQSLAEMERSLRDAPNRYNGLALAALAAERARKPEEARKYRAQAVTLRASR